MTKITQDQEKIKLIKRLVENQQITFEQGVSLLEVEIEYQSYPWDYRPEHWNIPYNPYPLKWTTTSGDIII